MPDPKSFPRCIPTDLRSILPVRNETIGRSTAREVGGEESFGMPACGELGRTDHHAALGNVGLQDLPRILDVYFVL